MVRYVAAKGADHRNHRAGRLLSGGAAAGQRIRSARHGAPGSHRGSGAPADAHGGIPIQIKLHAASLESYASIHQVVDNVQPDECYHLAAQSFVSYSFDDEFSTFNTNINGTHYMLAAVKNVVPKCRFYFAGSSEMFGKAEEMPQTERTRFHPRSTYGISKVAGFDLTRNYREAYGMHASSGILFNHESPRRGYEFVTRKITSGVARIRGGTARASCGWAIWTPSATGATPANTWRPCG